MFFKTSHFWYNYSIYSNFFPNYIVTYFWKIFGVKISCAQSQWR